MDDSTTIIITTKNKHPIIQRTIKKLKSYMKKYHNVKEIIFIDNYSTNGTLMKILSNIETENKMRLITTSKKKTWKHLLLQGIKETKTPNIIIFEPELYTRLHQIQRQIKKLRKCQLLLLNRFHSKSKTIWKNKQEEFKIRGKNYMTQLITGLEYTDITNMNKAFKKNKLLPIIKRIKSEKNFWEETILLCKKRNIRITETSTHYVQEEKPVEDPIIKFLHTIRDLRIIKKRILKK